MHLHYLIFQGIPKSLPVQLLAAQTCNSSYLEMARSCLCGPRMVCDAKPAYKHAPAR